MRWVTYRKAGDERVGLVVDDEVRALPPGVTLIELISAGAEQLAVAGHRVRRHRHDDDLRAARAEPARGAGRPGAGGGHAGPG